MELPNFPRDPVGTGSTPCFPLGCQVGWTVGRLKRWLIRWMVDWLEGRLDSGLISKLLWAQKERVFFLHRSPRFLTVKNVFPLLLTVDAAADSLENWPLLVFKMSFLLKHNMGWVYNTWQLGKKALKWNDDLIMINKNMSISPSVPAISC